MGNLVLLTKFTLHKTELGVSIPFFLFLLPVVKYPNQRMHYSSYLKLCAVQIAFYLFNFGQIEKIMRINKLVRFGTRSK